jgi:hypothetical protein
MVFLCCWVWLTKWQLMSWAWWHGNLGDMKKPSWLDYSMIDPICEMIRFIDFVLVSGGRIFTLWSGCLEFGNRICWCWLGVIGNCVCLLWRSHWFIFSYLGWEVSFTGLLWDYWSHDILILVLLMQGKVGLTFLKSSMPAMKVLIVPVYSHMVITFCRLPLYFGNL